jgi:hypothetical protein
LFLKEKTGKKESARESGLPQRQKGNGINPWVDHVAQ